jgi:hypothetical protein
MATLVERLERTAEEHGRTYVRLRSFSEFDSLGDYCAYLESEAEDPDRSDNERALIRRLLEQWREVEVVVSSSLSLTAGFISHQEPTEALGLEGVRWHFLSPKMALPALRALWRVLPFGL